MSDPLDGLPRLDDDALGFCAFCHRVMLEARGPVFYRFTVQYCGIEAAAVRRHIGLANVLGGGEAGLNLAKIMGPGTKPVVEMATGTVNVCLECAQSRGDVITLIAKTLEGDD